MPCDYCQLLVKYCIDWRICTVNFRCFPPGGFMHCQQLGKQRIRRQARIHLSAEMGGTQISVPQITKAANL
jgi:hypothetical protein